VPSAQAQRECLQHKLKESAWAQERYASLWSANLQPQGPDGMRRAGRAKKVRTATLNSMYTPTSRENQNKIPITNDK
jgi:hypothetical protein